MHMYVHVHIFVELKYQNIQSINTIIQHDFNSPPLSFQDAKNDTHPSFH